jgi:hypothetical protein
VPGGIDDVEARAFPDDAGAFRENGDAALPLQVVAVERALRDVLFLPEGPRLFKQRVDQRGLSMIDVGDDGDIANVHDVFRLLDPALSLIAVCGTLNAPPVAETIRQGQGALLRRTHSRMRPGTRV